MFIFAIIFLTLSLFGAENLVSVLVGGLAAFGVTQWLKSATGLAGLGATILALVVSLVVGVIAFLVSTFFSGNEITMQTVISGAAQIFTLATLAYRAFYAAQE